MRVSESYVGPCRAADIPTAKAFLEDVVMVCKRHGLTLGHEDFHGAFIVEHYQEGNIKQLRAAFFTDE